MNLPNRLTVARFFLTILFVCVLSSEWPWSRTAALLIFVIASVTDYVDGEIARRCNMITDFGKLMDPLMDKILTASAFICLVPLKAIPAWVAIIFVSREFLITGLRLLAGSKGQVLQAEKLGKHKTTWQMITIVFFLLLLSLKEISRLSGSQILSRWWSEAAWDMGGQVLVTIAVVLTVYSGIGYLWKHRSLIESA